MNFLKTGKKLDSEIFSNFLKIAENISYKPYGNSDYATASTENFLESNEYTDRLLKIINPKLNIAFPLILCVPRNTKMGIHVDSHPTRKSVISWALTEDLSSFSETYFYKDNQITETLFYGLDGVLVNTQVPHNVVNNNQNRYSLQICLYNDFDEVISIHNTEGIFNDSY